MIEFLTLVNVQPQQIHNRMIVVYGEMCHHAPQSNVGRPSFIETEQALKMTPRSEGPCNAICEENYCTKYCVDNLKLNREKTKEMVFFWCDGK